MTVSKLLDECPRCECRGLIAVCSVTVEYGVTNDGEGGQDWSRREVDDDDSLPSRFRCGNCGAEFTQFTLDGDGHLVSLESTASDARSGSTGGAMTAEQFRDWLTTRVDDWSHANGLAPHGEGEDLGDLFRHLEDMGAFEEIGVTVLADPIEQAFYFVGPDRSWVASTPYELGAELETVWWDPVSHLRLDLGDADLLRIAEGLRARADEFAVAADVTAGGAPH
jgi:hypothetical protein